MKRLIGFAVLLVALCVVRQAGAACGNAPGLRECTDAELNPQAALMADAPLFAKGVRGAGYVCDRVIAAYEDHTPTANYIHVTCDGQLQYTLGVFTRDLIIWPGDFHNY